MYYDVIPLQLVSHFCNMFTENLICLALYQAPCPKNRNSIANSLVPKNNKDLL